MPAHARLGRGIGDSIGRRGGDGNERSSTVIRRAAGRLSVGMARSALLAAYIAVIYVAIVLGVGQLWCAANGRSQFVLSLLAAGVIALGFRRARAGVDALLGRTSLGVGATPYRALTALVASMSSARELDEVLPGMAALLGAGTAARHSAVWLHVEEALVRVAVWPKQEPPAALVSSPDLATIAARSDVDCVVAARHGGELLGALTIVKAAGDPLIPVDRALISDMADSAAQLLRNARLSGELQERVGQRAARARELHASRRRLLAARDEERRRLAQAIEVGFSEQLLQMGEQLSMVRAQMNVDVDDAAGRLARLRDQTGQLITRLRELTHGIHPAVLRDHGLGPALESLPAAAPLRVAVPDGGVPRYGSELESALYFCCAQMIRTLIGQAGAAPLLVSLADDRDRVTVSVVASGDRPTPLTRDELDGLADPIAPFDGRIEAMHAPAGGLTLRASVQITPAPAGGASR